MIVSALGSLLFLILIIAAGIFWMWTLVDCLKAEWRNPTDRVVWLLVIVLLNLLGSILYVLIAPNDKASRG